MPANNLTLAKAVEELKRVLREDIAGRESTWSRRLDEALARVEQAASRHRACLEDEQGRVVDVDTPLNPSPTVARRSDELRQELDALLREAGRLRGKLATLHPASNLDAQTAAGALPVAPETADIADFGVFCERVETLLQRFEHFDADESELIQESVTLDLGAGD
jgi:hypothetical protein